MPLLAESVRSLTSVMIIAAILVAGLYHGQDILVPLSIAVLLSFILAPVVRALERRRVPDSVAVTVSVVTAVGLIFAGLFAFSTQLLALADNLDQYKVNVLEKVRWVLDSSGGDSALSRAADAIGRLQEDVARELSGPGSAGTGLPGDIGPVVAAAADDKMAALKNVALVIGAPLGKAALAILLTFFLLLQHADLRDRILRVAGTDNLSSTTAAMTEAGTRLSTLFLAQAVLNAAFGFVVGIALWIIGVPNALLWGITAGVMRFVPFIGSFLAAVPPLLLAAGVEPGWGMFISTLMLFAIGEPMMGHVLEPLVLGKRAGLSPFGVVMALSLWTLIWGPIGLLLAVPMTLAIVVLGRYVPGLEFLSVLLGDEPALTPQQRLYNRLLSKDGSAAIAQIEEANTAGSLTAAADDVVLPALQLASSDYVLERLEDRQVSAMGGTMELVAEAFGDAGGMQGTARSSKDSTSIVVVPARGPIDAMAAKFIATLLNTLTPYRVRAATTASGLTALADAKATLAPDDQRPHIVIASLGASESAQLRLIVNRAASYFPHNPVLIVGSGRSEHDIDNDKVSSNWVRVGQLVELLRSKTLVADHDSELQNRGRMAAAE